MAAAAAASSSSSIDKLSAWLRANAPLVGNTVPMPLKPASKRPLFPHAKPRSWGWAQVDDFRRSPANKAHAEWGLLLDRLCAVDADDAHAVACIERAIDADADDGAVRCPVQLTSSGRHYLFLRPKWADEEGFFDGARQLRDAISADFKSVCATGTRGLLCVAPSRNKRWAEGRAPWDAGVRLIEIPRRVLEAVAAPKRRPRRKPEPSSSCASPAPPHQVQTLPSVSSADHVTKLLHLVSKSRWDCYASWRDLATALKNDHGDLYRDTWLALSAVSPKFDRDAALALWDSVARPDYAGPRLSMRTVHDWAAKDDPAGYQALKASLLAPKVLEWVAEEDKGLARIAQHELADVVKKCGTKGDNIYYFDAANCRWRLGDKHSIVCMVSDAVVGVLRTVDVHLAISAAAETDDEARKALDQRRKDIARHIKYMNKRNGMTNVAELMVQEAPDAGGFFQLLDSVPHLLGVANGVVDLRTGELRARRPEDLIFTVLDVVYDPHAATDLVAATVLSIMADDADMAAYLQKLLGYGITGEVSEEIFAVFTANGRNGKGLLMKLLADLLGPFYKEMNCGVIVNRQVSNMDAEKGKLLGARVAVFNELEAGEKLKTSEVQLLSGGDGIPARPLYKDPLTIQPHHLCILTTNHMPELATVVTAIVERLVCVHFPVTFADLEPDEPPSPFRRQRDNSLKALIAKDRAGVFRWLVEGAVQWYRAPNLKSAAPAKVRDFSAKYFEEQDRIVSFFQQCCVRDGAGDAGGRRIATRDLLAAFNDWARFVEKGSEMAEKKFAAAMRQKGYEPHVMRIPGYDKPLRGYEGIALVPTTTTATTHLPPPTAVADDELGD